MTLCIDAFERGDIDPDGFDHAAHIELAWRYQAQFGVAAGNQRFEDALKRFVASPGQARKFHATTTGFFLNEIARRRGDGFESWPEFRRRNRGLFSDAGDLLLQHYTADTLASADASERFLSPDKRDVGRSNVSRVSPR